MKNKCITGMIYSCILNMNSKSGREPNMKAAKSHYLSLMY